MMMATVLNYSKRNIHVVSVFINGGRDKEIGLVSAFPIIHIQFGQNGIWEGSSIGDIVIVSSCNSRSISDDVVIIRMIILRSLCLRHEAFVVVYQELLHGMT